jgi:hypothetical protein
MRNVVSVKGVKSAVALASAKILCYMFVKFVQFNQLQIMGELLTLAVSWANFTEHK